MARWWPPIDPAARIPLDRLVEINARPPVAWLPSDAREQRLEDLLVNVRRSTDGPD